MNNFKDIVVIFMPEVEAAEEGYLWAKYGVSGIEGVNSLYFCDNQEIAQEVLVNQIKPFIQVNEGYFIIFPMSDGAQINASNTKVTTSFSVVHYGAYDTPKAQSIARSHVISLLEMFRENQNRYISSISLNNTDFQKWSDDNSVLQQYTCYVSVSYVEPYLIGRC